MELLGEIYDSDIIGDNSYFEWIYKVRKASRALVYNELNQIAILFVSKDNYHKLPWGWVEEWENIKETVKREVKEEVWWNISIWKEIGLILEYRKKIEQLQISYCYISKLLWKLEDTAFTEKEIADGFQLKWVTLDEAIKILESDSPKNYVGKYIVKRDLIFLKNWRIK